MRMNFTINDKSHSTNTSGTLQTYADFHNRLSKSHLERAEVSDTAPPVPVPDTAPPDPVPDTAPPDTVPDPPKFVGEGISRRNMEIYNQKIVEIEKICCTENTLLIEEHLVIEPYNESIYTTNENIAPTHLANVTDAEDTIQMSLERSEPAGAGERLNSVGDSRRSLNISQTYKNKLEVFMDQDSKTVYNDPKIEFRYFCFKYLDYILNCFIIPEIDLNQTKEAVFIEFREFPHVEFLIRNAIMRIGSDWSYTVVCGNENYNFMISICNNISKNIKIIKTVNNNIPISKYNYLLKSVDFWKMLIEDTILIYQEDSFIFNNNIKEYTDIQMNLFITSKNDNRMKFTKLFPNEFSLSTPTSRYRRRNSVSQLRSRLALYLLNSRISKEPRKYKTHSTNDFEGEQLNSVTAVKEIGCETIQTPSAIAYGVKSLPGAYGFGSLQRHFGTAYFFHIKSGDSRTI